MGVTSHDFSANTQLDVRAYYDAYRLLRNLPLHGRQPEAAALFNVNDAAADGVGLEMVVGHRLGRHRIVAGVAGEHNFRINQRNYYAGMPPLLDDHRTLSLAAMFGEVELNPSSKSASTFGGRVDWYNLYGTNVGPRVAANVEAEFA